MRQSDKFVNSFNDCANVNIYEQSGLEIICDRKNVKKYVRQITIARKVNKINFVEILIMREKHMLK